MLSRTADNIYWMGRYLERTEGTARLLLGLHHMTLMPTRRRREQTLWHGLYQTPQERDEFLATYGQFDTHCVTMDMVLGLSNPSSVRRCVFAARENVRATRHVLSAEIWESVNQTWLDISGLNDRDVREQGLRDCLELVKQRIHLIRGIVHGTLRRDESFGFWSLGTQIERAENIIRLLCAREGSFTPVKSGRKKADAATLDYYEWGSLLRAASSYKAYREVYKSHLDPRLVAELMILNPDLPRSIMSCVDEICGALKQLRPDVPSLRQAREMSTRLKSAQIDRIYRSGVVPFLHDLRAALHDLSLQAQKDFLMIR